MTTTVRVKLDYRGIGEVLKSQEMADMVTSAAKDIASKVSVDAPVVVNDYTTDRQAAAVTIASDEGLTMQARDGALTKAAGAIGAEVTET